MKHKIKLPAHIPSHIDGRRVLSCDFAKFTKNEFGSHDTQIRNRYIVLHNFMLKQLAPEGITLDDFLTGIFVVELSTRQSKGLGDFAAEFTATRFIKPLSEQNTSPAA